MSASTGAWVLDCGGGAVVAVGLASVLHLIEDTSLLFNVPLAPSHCNQVMVWQQRVLPVIDLAVQLNALVNGVAPAVEQRYACLLGWRASEAASDTEYGVLIVRALPRRIVVDDNAMMTPSDAEAARWRELALCFFSHHGTATPIIDPAALFGSRQHVVLDQVALLEDRTA